MNTGPNLTIVILVLCNMLGIVVTMFLSPFIDIVVANTKINNWYTPAIYILTHILIVYITWLTVRILMKKSF